MVKYSGFAFGWSIILPIAGGHREIDVLVKPDYPFQPAALAVPKAEAWPGAHVADGLLCLRGTTEAHQIFSDERVLARDLERAAALFVLSRDEAEADRAAEFMNYWKAASSNPTVYSLIDEQTPYGKLVAWYGKQFTLISPDEAVARAWLAARFDTTEPFEFDFALYVDGALLELTVSTASQVHELALNAGDSNVSSAFEASALANQGRTTIVFRLPGDFALVAGSVTRPPVTKTIVRRSAHPGFRPGHEPPRMAARRFYAAQDFVHDRLERVDPPWILARGGERFDPELHARHVVVIGVGSLGSGVARGLVKAGIGRITLLDCDLLRWENVARHELGGVHVGESKALAVRDDLRRDFPFAKVDGYPVMWQEAHRKNDALFDDADLVVATTGDWPSECQLNHLLRSDKNVTMVFGWAEPWAAATHVLVVKPKGGCLACGMNAAGDFVERVIEWPTSQLQSVPACGQTYMPFGDATAMRARAAIIEEIIYALTMGVDHSTLYTELNEDRLYAPKGGSLRDAFAARLGRAPEVVGARIRSPWPQQAHCAVCKRAAA